MVSKQNGIKKSLAAVAIYALVFGTLPVMDPPKAEAQNRTIFANVRNAADYAFGLGTVPGLVVDGPALSTAGVSTTYTVAIGTTVAGDGTTFAPLSIVAPITITDANGADTATPTAVSCSSPAILDTCTVTATFTNAHGKGARISSGTAGLQEALDIQSAGVSPNSGLLGGWGSQGGRVGIDARWTQLGGTNALITAAQVVPGATIEDNRSGGILYWNPQGGATIMTTPTTLTSSTALDQTTPAGTWTTSAYAQGVACVDIMGQEGPVSLTYAHTPASLLSSVTFVAPTNCVGAVGYVVYSTLASASYPLAYELPLVTQPTVIGTYPVSNGNCTLTTLETVTPACAVANTTFGQTASNATFTAIPLSTSPIAPEVTTVSTTSVYVPSPGGRTTYSYTPSSRVSVPGLVSGWLPFTITTAVATVVPNVLGTVNIPPNFMNLVGRQIEVCGEATTTASVATIVDIQFQWDSWVQNTAGKGVLIGDATATPAVALVTGKATFCQDFQTTVASASSTGGSINHVNTFGAVGGTTLVAGGAFSDAIAAGAAGSLNLAQAARINVIYLHTTATDGAGWILQNLTVHVVN